jgi:ribosome maturation factor RimP
MPDLLKQTVTAKIAEIVERIGESEGMEIVDVQLLGGGKARVLRIFIDKPEGVSHADCELMSQRVGTVLDEEDVVPGEGYTREVSSPGIERKLSKPRDFERFVGQTAKFLLREPVDNQRRWEGTLAGFSNGVVSLEVSAGKRVQIPLTQVEKANLKFRW